MKYKTGEEVHPGDKVKFYEDRLKGTVVEMVLRVEVEGEYEYFYFSQEELASDDMTLVSRRDAP